MSPPRIFLSYTHRAEIDQKAATAFLLEFRRVGLDVWIDRENPPRPATEEQKAAGPTPANPLFEHIVSALADCDAVLYVASQTSLQREYVRLEHDPRVIFQSFREKHPDISSDNLPFWLAIVSTISNPPPFWPILIDEIVSGHILNLTGAESTPLIVPMVLTNMIREIAPENLLPLYSVAEYWARTLVEEDASEAPGCPSGVPAKIWRRFEAYFGLGPLFPGPLPLPSTEEKDNLYEDQLKYGLSRIQDTTRVLGVRPKILDHLLALWLANIRLRSNTLRIHDGNDLPLYILSKIRERLEHTKEEQKELFLAVSLQLGYALLTSGTRENKVSAIKILEECKRNFGSINATPLEALAQLLSSRAAEATPPSDTIITIENLGCNYQTADIRHLYHKILDSAFPGPRIEASTQYFSTMRLLHSKYPEAARELRGGFAKSGEEKLPPFWQRIFNKNPSE